MNASTHASLLTTDSLLDPAPDPGGGAGNCQRATLTALTMANR